MQKDSEQETVSDDDKRVDDNMRTKFDALRRMTARGMAKMKNAIREIEIADDTEESNGSDSEDGLKKRSKKKQQPKQDSKKNDNRKNRAIK